jgi:hypothetical protein
MNAATNIAGHESAPAAAWHRLAQPISGGGLLPIRPAEFMPMADPFLHAHGPAPGSGGPLIGGGDIQTAAFDRVGSTAMHRAVDVGLRNVLVRIENFEAGAAKYAAHLLFGNSTATAGENLTLPEGLSDTGNNNALLVNLAETGGGHQLPLQSVHCGVFVGFTAESPPRAIVMVHHGGPALQPVQVLKDGGADGTQTAPATWTYTIKSVDGSQTFATTVPPARPRPNGSMVIQTSTPAFGTAFVDATGTWRLWDAGEIPATTACS